MRRSIEVLLAAAVTGFVAFQVGSCGRDTVRDERDTAYKLANHYRWQRDSTAKAQAKTDTVTRTVILADARLREQRDSLMSVLTYADSVRRDSLATNAELRVTLGVTINRALSFQRAADSLQAVTRDLIAAQAEERFRTNRTLALADSAIAGWKGVADAERRRGWRRFTQGAFVGGIVALLAAVAL